MRERNNVAGVGQKAAEADGKGTKVPINDLIEKRAPALALSTTTTTTTTTTYPVQCSHHFPLPTPAASHEATSEDLSSPEGARNFSSGPGDERT